MAKVDLTIGGNSYTLACRDGEEARLTQLAALVDAKAHDARRAVGGTSETRQLLFAALLLADELEEARKGKTSAPASPTAAAAAESTDQDAEELENLAAQLESLALRLEQRG